jgi:hypothetical protein
LKRGCPRESDAGKYSGIFPDIKFYDDRRLCTHLIAQDKTCEETGIKLNICTRTVFNRQKAFHKKIEQNEMLGKNIKYLMEQRKHILLMKL